MIKPLHLFVFRMAMPTILLVSGCTLFQSGGREERIGVWPGGVVTRVNFAEKFLIFEASHQVDAGTEWFVMREGQRVGTIRIRPERRKRYLTADLLEGSVAVGDVVERPLGAQAKEGDQGEGRRLRP